jgi:hypothetical protein
MNLPRGGGYVGLLDLFPNAAAAYSLRKLRAAYSGSAVRVRKEVSTVSSETDIGFLADGTLDTVSLLAFASDADSGDVFVVTWYDQSLSNDATQSTATAQPKIVDAGVLVEENGKPAVDFDGVDDRLITSSFASTLAQPNTTFIVNNCPNNTTDNTLIDGIVVSNRHLLIANANNYTLSAGTFASTGANSDAQSLLYTLWNGASSEFASDGETPNIINTGTQGLTGLTIGTNFVSVNANDGNIQELIFFNSDQSSNRTGIETNINTFYSVYP